MKSLIRNILIIIVFKRLLDAGLTLRGSKCHIGMNAVHYLGHVFSGTGMSPDPNKVQVCHLIPTRYRYVT